MLTEPTLDKAGLAAALVSALGIVVDSLTFLPMGADARSFSYRAEGPGGPWFVKLRLRGPDDREESPAALVTDRVLNAIRPLRDPKGSSVVDFESFQVTVSPFVTGTDGWKHALTANQWRAVGRTFRSLHGLALPAAIRNQLPLETYSSVWRERALSYLEAAPSVHDASGEAFRSLLRTHDVLSRTVINQAQVLADHVSRHSLELVPCHGDFHSGNFLIEADGTLHPVDWDTLSLAPKEKDLMFVGAGIGGMLDAHGGAAPFYEGYGRAEVNQDALHYFRLERIVQDLVAYAEQLLDSTEGGEDRPVMLQQVQRQFEPGGVIEIALTRAGS